MKLLYVLPQPYLLSRGSSFRAQATVEALVELGHDVEVLCYGLGNDPRMRSYAIHRAWRPPGIRAVKVGPSLTKIVCDIPLTYSAWRLASRNRYDVIHGVEEAGFIAAWLGVRSGIPYIYDMHSWMSQQIEGTSFGKWKWALRHFKRLELSAMNRARAILTVGAEMTRLLQSELAPGVYSATLPDCPLSFDTQPSPERRKEIEQRFFQQPGKIILYTGNFHPYQGIDLLISAMRELKAMRSESDYRLLLVGGGEGERSRVAQYQATVKEWGLEDRIVFCGEYPVEETAVFMEHADILVSSRISGNNVPLKVYTFLASGIPLVATRIASHTQVLNDENAILAEPAPSAFAQALGRALFELTPEARARMKAAAARITPEEQRSAFKKVLEDCYARCR
ncbi:MAG TPA: glycosyltransferase [Kiritimatiellia bacterium]|nr:glycosyltransferase [Kiritimatiellia bacterium]HMO98996.1 glycosyltransferase [Kiritimatiellia bacterium]HMP95883.1 glycosyltransferase [Kiritimatiellia bacterium]